MIDLKDMLAGYIECALWACSIPADSDGVPVEPDMDGDYPDGTREDTPCEDCTAELSEEARKEAAYDCSQFVAYCEEECPEALAEYLQARNDSSLGHDFHLSRNGHGAGFFDRGIGACDKVLQAAAKTFGTHGIMASDKDTLIFHGQW